MARLILSSGEAVGLSSGTYTVFGTATGSETVSFGETAVVTFDASFNAGGDTIDLAGNAADYTVVRSGSQVILTNASGGSFTIPVGTAGATISFDDGDRTLAFNSVAGQIELGDQAVTSTAAAVAAGSGAPAAADPDSFSLTAGIDAGNAFAGGDGVTTYFANDATLTLGDNLDGGEGSDVLSLVSAAATAFAGFTTTSVEQYSIQPLVTGASLAVNSASSGLNDINIHDTNGTIAAFALTGVGLGTSVTVDTAIITALNLGFAAAAGASDAVRINLSGVSATTIDITSAGVETVNLVANSATTLAALANTGTGTTTLGVSGAGNLTITGALTAGTQTVSAASHTGNLAVTLANDAAPDAAVAGVDVVDTTVTTGSGNDVITLSNSGSAVELLVDAGAGNDSVIIGGAALSNSSATNAGDTVSGGLGDDTLSVTSAAAVAQTAVTGVSGFEALTISTALGGSVTVANYQATGIATVTLAAGSAAGGALVLGSGVTVNLADQLGAAFAVTDTGTGTSDVVTLTNTDAAADAFNGQNLTVTGFETVNLVTTGTGAAAAQTTGTIAATADTGGTVAIAVSGSNSITLGAITATTGSTLSGAGLTGTATLTNVANTGIATITGSANGDTLVASGTATTINAGGGNDGVTGGAAADVINGGDGNDTISSGGGADTINGDAGNDQITMGASAAQVINGGAGDDTVFAGSNLAFGQTVSGGDGIDVLDVEAAVGAAAASVLSGFETLNLDGTISQDLDIFTAGNGAFTNVVLEDDTYTVSSIRSENIVLTAALTGGSTLTLEDAAGAADSISIVTQGNADLDFTNTITIAGVETVNITTSDTNTATGDTHTIDLVVTSATTINVFGNAGLDLNGGSENVSAVTTMDASGVVLSAANALTDGVSYVASYNLVGGVTTITGSNGADSLTGNANTNDTINGGAGVDTLVYTGGTDTFTGGAGADTFDVNALVTNGALTITDAAVGDIVDFAGLLGTAANIDIAAAGWDAAEVSLGPAATLANYLDAAASAATAGTGNEVVTWFEFGGDTYIVVDNSDNATFNAATDSVFILDGVTGLVNGSSVTDGVLTIA